MDEIHLGEGEVRHEFIGDWLVVQKLCDSRVWRVDRRDNTRVDLEVQALRVDVVRLDEVVIIRLAHDGGVVTVLNIDIVVQPDDAKV